MHKLQPSQKSSSPIQFYKRELLYITAAGLVSCSHPAPVAAPIPISPSIPSPAPTAVCESFNQGDPLDGRLGTSALTIKVPVDRRESSKRTAVIVPVNGPSQTLWIYQTTTGWAFADKQTVGIAADGLLDLQPMHRIDARTYPNIVQVIGLSSDHWRQKITLQPVLEGSTSRWGRPIPFPMRISVQGQVYAFRGIERGLSGEALPKYLNRVLDQLKPGSIYIPQNGQIEVAEPIVANPQICPVTRSTSTAY